MQRLLRALAALLALALIAATALPLRTAYAAEPTITEEDGIAALQEYFVVRGDQNGDLRLDSQLTRAEAAAIFVRAMGMSQYAPAMTADVPFDDARGHWGAGEIAMAERLGLMKGDTDGPGSRFRPNDQITYAEILTVLLRMVNQEPTGSWNPQTIMAKAGELRIAPGAVEAAAPAVRRKVFWALAAAITTVPVERGATLASKNLDQEPPTLNLAPVTSPTGDEKITFGGTTVGATRVLVEGKPAQFDRKTQTFSYKATLKIGSNTFLVEAFDPAGNRTAENLTVERRGTISKITITGPKSIVANSATRLTVEARDRSGNLLPIDQLEAEVTGDAATFDLATTALVAGDKAGKGSLTLKAGTAKATFAFTVVAPSPKANRLVIQPINKDVPIALNKEQLVTVQVVDEAGKVVSDDYGRTVSLLSSGPAAVTITPVTPVTEKGVATFKVVGTTIGLTTLTATTPNLGQVARPMEVLTARRVMLVPSVKALAPDGASTVTIKAMLQDDTGKRINNDTGMDMQIILTAAGTDSVLTGPYLTIPQGKSDSGAASATLTAGIAPGVVAIRGRFATSHTYAIQALQFPVNTPLAGSQLALTAATSPILPGGETAVTLQVLDGSGNLVSEGSYAFQLYVTTSNNEPLFQGLPEGVSLNYVGSAYYPLDDGRAPNDAQNDPYSVVGRTVDGEATVLLSYGRSGVVRVQAVPLPATDEAYNPVTGLGPASPSTGLWAPVLEIPFQGAPARIELAVDSAIGKNLKEGAVGGSATMTLRARVVDGGGNTVPGYNELLTLSRLDGGDKVTSIYGIHQRTAVDGVVEFTVQAQNAAGLDQYQVSVGSMISNPVTLTVRKAKAETPVVVAIRGVTEGDANQTPGFVGPGSTYMNVQLEPQVADPRETEYWVTAKVYRQNETSPIYTQAIDLRDPVPVIRVPKGYLRVGTSRYRVVINNGYGDTAYSSTLDPITEALVATYNDSYKLNSATYDAETGKLYLNTAGLAADGSIDTSKLSIVKGSNILSLGSDQVTVVTPISSSRVTLDLGDLAASLNPDVWNGTVYVQAETAWYVNKAGTAVARSFDEVALTPMAVIRDGALDLTGKRLYLNGAGLSQGAIKWNLVTVRSSATEGVALRPSYDKVNTLTDTEAIITLSDATYNAITALTGPDLYITATSGWIQSGSSSTVARGAELLGTDRPVLLRLLASEAQYDDITDTLTIRGSAGFNGLTLDPSRLIFKVRPSDVGWSPSQTATVVASDDTSVSIVLEPDDADGFEAAFGGQNVYLNTLAGWLTDPQGRQVMPIPDYSVLFRVIAR